MCQYLKVIAIIYKGNTIRLKSSKLIIHSFFRTIDLPIRMKAQAVDKFVLAERLKEEQILLRMKMMNFLSLYLENILPKLRQKKMDINTRIGWQLLLIQCCIKYAVLVILSLIFFHVEYINNLDEPDDKYSNDQVYMSLRFLLIRINIIEVLSKSNFCFFLEQF